MSFKNRLFVASAVLVATSSVAFGEMMDRPTGIKIGQRMTLRPYLAVSGAYDSNVEGGKDGCEEVTWVVNPGLSLDYLAESWSLTAGVWYQYNAYSKGTSSAKNYHSYGEDVTFKWSNSLPSERGWSLMLSEKYQVVNQIDNFVDSIGHEYDRDRQEFTLAGVLQRRFTDRFHGAINGNYYWLDYKNNNSQNRGYGLYGWDRWGVGAEIGYAFSNWTDLILAGSYQDYRQQNRKNNYYSGARDYGESSGSHGYTVQAGLGSYATERIKYRVLGGWSTYTYDEGGKSSDGFTYSISANWRMSDTWNMMLLASSYFQPTEREYGSSQRVDSLSWGIAHAMIQGKLNATFDVAYRREGREYAAVKSYDYDLDIYTGRLGLTYILNRYLQVFGNLEYRQSISEGNSLRGDHYDYDRFRGTLGLRLTY